MHVRASRAGRGFTIIKRTFFVPEIDSGAHILRVVAARGLSCGASRRDSIAANDAVSALKYIHRQLAAIAPADEHQKRPAVAAHSLWLETFHTANRPCASGRRSCLCVRVYDDVSDRGLGSAVSGEINSGRELLRRA
jgi:hypothetical protein